MASESTSNNAAHATPDMSQAPDKAWSMQGFTVIDGTTYPSCVTPEILEQIKDIEVRDDDIWIITYPKSGTRWCFDIVAHIQGNKANIEKASSMVLPLALNLPVFSPPKSASDPSLNHHQIAGWESPRVIRSHLSVNNIPRQIFTKKPKVIYVMRNPKDALISNFKLTIPKSMKEKNDSYATVAWKPYLHVFLEGKASYGFWGDHVKGYWQHRMDPNFLILSFEDMKKDPYATVRQIAKFLGVSQTDDEVRHVVEATSFENTKKRTANSDVEKHFRKGAIGDWKSVFTVEDNERFDAKIAKALEGTDIKLQF